MATDQPITSEQAKKDSARAAQKRYNATPKGRAKAAWHRLKARAGGGGGPGYLHVEVRLTQEEFCAWAIPEYERWLREHPGVKPSVDRIDSKGHYEIGNIRMISLRDNVRASSHFHNWRAPEGMAWCSKHRAFLPIQDFYGKSARYGNLEPRRAYCKSCQREYERQYRQKLYRAWRAQERGGVVPQP